MLLVTDVEAYWINMDDRSTFAYARSGSSAVRYITPEVPIGRRSCRGGGAKGKAA